MKDKIIAVIAIISLTVSVLAFLRPAPVPQYTPVPVPQTSVEQQKFGAIGGMLAEQYIPYVRYNGGFKSELSLSIGSTTPKDIIQIGGGTCNLTKSGSPTQTFAATTSLMHFCSATGVRVGDQIFVTLPASSGTLSSSSPLTGPQGQGSIMVAGAVATTSDSIGVLLTNFTGSATSSYTQATTSVKYFFVR